MKFAEYVRFEVPEGKDAAERFRELSRFVLEVANAKNEVPGGQICDQPDEELYRWLALLPNPARGTFASPPTPGAWLPPDQPLEPGWDELSFLDVLLSTETHIGDVEYISEKLGKLQFSALAWPYGGIGSMLRLVEAFGFRITSYDEGSMPEVTRDQHLSWSTK